MKPEIDPKTKLPTSSQIVVCLMENIVIIDREKKS
jgi:hypothetical protein